MSFSAKQIQALRRQPNPIHIRTREVDGRELSYLEGWYAISEANRIFGFDGWSRETLETRCAMTREMRGTFVAIYLARVRVSVQADGTTVIREGHGTGEGRGISPGLVHDVALKAAETDATKRALATFGKPFGLELYRNGKLKNWKTEQTEPGPDLSAITEPARLGFHPDDTTPIPRPSRYYGRRSDSIAEQFRGERRAIDHKPVRAPSPVRNHADLMSTSIDKSQLTISEPKRLRDKMHLKFVASQPCLVCGRQPSDPHHLRFAQLRAIGVKVSDEFTVPLCRGHHRQLHQVGNELDWWSNFKIEPLEIAHALWKQTHPETRQFVADATGAKPEIHDKTNPIGVGQS